MDYDLYSHCACTTTLPCSPDGRFVGYLSKESSDIQGPKFVKQNGVHILSIQKTQVLTTHE